MPKKTSVYIGGNLYILEKEIEFDKFEATHQLILRESQKENGWSKTKCFQMMKVSSSGYYSWLNTKEDRKRRKEDKRKENNKIKEKMKAIIAKIGHVPGKRTFKLYLARDYGIYISIKKCRKLMMSMHLVAAMPKKDAYKGQAKHFHEACALQNHVQQDFKIGPRQVILTDITYLYYGLHRELFYLCAFKDAFTNQMLGWATSKKMDVSLVKEAYNQMNKNHGKELKKSPQVYIHSDQGSQYLSTDFKRIISDDEFIQSVSARGNSQDNAPMESFFGRMKTEALDIIALSPDYETATRIIDGYMHQYNEERYQYSLAGLTPNEYYEYMISGIYPLDSYYGVKADELLNPKSIVEARRKKADEKAKKRREASKKKREERAQLTDVAKIFERDQRKVRKIKREWESSKKIAEKQIEYLEKLHKSIYDAHEFYINASREIKDELRNPLSWNKYPELNYVNELDALY